MAKPPPRVRNRIPDRELGTDWTPTPVEQAKHRAYLKTLNEDHDIIKIYYYVIRFYKDFQRPATFTEIATGVKNKVKSNNSVLMALKRLVLASWVERIYGERKRGDGCKYKPAVTPFSDLYDKVVLYCRKFYVENGIPANVPQITKGMGHATSRRVREVLKLLVSEKYLTAVEMNGRAYYKPPEYGVVNLQEHYALLEWAGRSKKVTNP